jgi:hypothetical protein
MPETDAPWQVRIATPDGRILGAGILLDSRTVLTTSGVIQATATANPDESTFHVRYVVAFPVRGGPAGRAAPAGRAGGSGPGR